MTEWSLDLGGIRLRGVAEEDAFAIPRDVIFPDATPAQLAAGAALDPGSADAAADLVVLRLQVFVIEAFGRIALVDGGLGDGKERPARPAWHRRRTDFLARLGVSPADVRFLLFTHLHADHVGWATRLEAGRWVPTFPRARHLVAASEFAHWSALDAVAPVNHGAFRDSVLPLAEAGLLDEVPADHAPLRGVRFRPLPGHTQGQVGIELHGTALRVLIAADAIHHPLQLGAPGVVSAFCADPAQAIATRRALLEEAAEGLPLIPHHARGRPVWRVARAGGAYTLGAE